MARLLSLSALLAPAAAAIHFTPEVRFNNVGTERLYLHWLQTSPTTLFKRLRPVEPGRHSMEGTTKGHVFGMFTEEGTAGTSVEVQGTGTVNCRTSRGGPSGLIRVVCEAEWEVTHPYEGQAWSRFTYQASRNCSTGLVAAGHPGDALHFCHPDFQLWTHMQCRYDSTEQEWRRLFQVEYEKGAKHTREQPAKYRNFTEDGYKALAIPADLLRDLRAFWQKGRLSDKSEPVPTQKLGAALAACESDVWLIDLTPELREKIFSTVAPIIAKWAGVPLEGLRRTACYGVRMYRNSSRLYMHVDKWETHALSAILEVGHLSFGKPDTDMDGTGQWPLEVINHKGKVAHVPSKAGQMILYESATIPHGRPSAFPGREFANLFVHFAPQGWPEQYQVPGAQAMGSDRSSKEL